MSKSVGQHLDATAPAVAARVVDNKDLCNFFMGLLGRLIVLAAQRGLPLEGIRVAAPEMSERRITARVSFSALAVPAPAIFGAGVASGDDFRHYAASKSVYMARAMEKNPEFGRYFERALHLVEGWCADHGKDFRAAKVWKAFISPDDVIVLHMGNG